MKELLKSLYERNDQYHDTKEHVMWLAATLYFWFSLAVLAWISKNKCIWESRKLLFILFLSIAFLLVVVFVWFQNWKKCESLVKNDKLLTLMAKLDNKKPPNYQALAETMHIEKGEVKIVCEGKAKIIREGLPGVIVLFAVILFFAAQIIFLFIW